MSGRGGGGGGVRAPSGPWSRLKPANVDPLESYGLPSKGDNRLLDFKTQERYYTKIVDRYMSFCSRAGRGDELLRRLSSLQLESSPIIPTTSTTTTALTPTPPLSPALATTTTTSGTTSTPAAASDNNTPAALLPSDPQSTKDLSTLLMSLRKLREAIVATARADTFAAQCYIFAIRLSILLRHPESYHPALLYLLHTLLPRGAPLSSSEVSECAAYLVLDLACRQGDLAGAYAARASLYSGGVGGVGIGNRNGSSGSGHERGGTRLLRNDSKIDRVLKALVHDDYCAFWRLKRGVDGYCARLMEWAEEGVRGQALKCLGRTYFTLELGFVESVAGGRKWAELVSRDRVGWELQEGGTRVLLRKVKGSS